MGYHYVFYEEAQKDYEEALEWYLQRSAKAATDFVDRIDDALANICKSPGIWRNTYKHYHEFGLKKFPFIIIYSIEEDQKIVAVWKVFHYKRHPKSKFAGV